jgi:hypothetical protein
MSGWHDWSDFMPWFWTGSAGLLGRLMFHARQVQAGNRKPISWAVLWDLPIALGTGWTAFGAATYFQLQWEVSISAVIAASYLGPYTIDNVFAKWADRKIKNGA